VTTSKDTEEGRLPGTIGTEKKAPGAPGERDGQVVENGGSLLLNERVLGRITECKVLTRKKITREARR